MALDDLQARADAITTALRQHRRPQVFCHRDFHMGNVLNDGSRLWIIDWKYADWSDPLLEVARFAALAHMSSMQASALLQAYYQASPSPEDVRYVQWCMAAVNLEFFAHNYRLNGLTDMTLRYMQAVVNDGDNIADLPPVRLAGG